MALAAIAYADEAPTKRIEKRGIYGGIGLPLGLGGLPLAAPIAAPLAAHIAAPIAPYGLGLGSPLVNTLQTDECSERKDCFFTDCLWSSSFLRFLRSRRIPSWIRSRWIPPRLRRHSCPSLNLKFQDHLFNSGSKFSLDTFLLL